MPDVLKEAVGLREKSILVFPYPEMHFKKGAEFWLGLGLANREARSFRLTDCAMGRIVHAIPQRIECGAQVQPVPLCLLRKCESRIVEWQVVVQAAQRDGTLLRKKVVREQAPGIHIIDQRIAIIRKGQRPEPFSQHVRDATARKTRSWLSAIVQHQVGKWLPSIGLGPH